MEARQTREIQMDAVRQPTVGNIIERLDGVKDHLCVLETRLMGVADTLLGVQPTTGMEEAGPSSDPRSEGQVRVIQWSLDSVEELLHRVSHQIGRLEQL